MKQPFKRIDLLVPDAIKHVDRRDKRNLEEVLLVLKGTNYPTYLVGSCLNPHGSSQSQKRGAHIPSTPGYSDIDLSVYSPVQFVGNKGIETPIDTILAMPGAQLAHNQPINVIRYGDVDIVARNIIDFNGSKFDVSVTRYSRKYLVDSQSYARLI